MATHRTLNFTLASPTQKRFIWSDKLEKCLMGPRGEGKTEAGIMSITHHAFRQDQSARPIPWAIIRDTWKNLERTTLESFLRPRPGSFAAQIRPLLIVRDSGRIVEFPGYWRAYLFGIDSLGDLDRLQSLQLGGLWIEEPAPAAVDEIGGGLDERVVTAGISSLRHPCDVRTCQLTMNYPDEEHWTWVRYAVKRSPQRALFRIPRGENRAVDDQYRDNMAAALADDQGLLDRLVLGRPGFVVQGEAVTPEYDPLKHKADVDYEPNPDYPVWRAWDGGLNPTCVFAQVSPAGRLQVFPWTCTGSNIGVRQLIETQVQQTIATWFPRQRYWEDVCDPSMANRDPSSSATSAAKTIADPDLLGGSPIPGIVKWTPRLNALKSALVHTVDGLPWITISASETILSRALRGGWHYRKDAAGRVLRDIPVKDRHSHPGDAFSYLVSHLYRKQVWTAGQSKYGSGYDRQDVAIIGDLYA